MNLSWKSLGILCLSHVIFSLRHTRSLVYIDGGTYKFNIGIGVPLEVPYNFLSWSYNFQFQYSLPENITEFTQYYSRSLRIQERSLVTDGTSMDRREAGVLTMMDRPTDVPVHRGVIYQTLEERLNRNGLNGRACILRAICEAAETPLLHNGLLGELLHVILTPDYGSSSVNLLDEDYILAQDADYLLAQDAGKSYWTSCQQKFPECPPGQGLLDLISLIEQ